MEGFGMAPQQKGIISSKVIMLMKASNSSTSTDNKANMLLVHCYHIQFPANSAVLEKIFRLFKNTKKLNTSFILLGFSNGIF